MTLVSNELKSGMKELYDKLSSADPSTTSNPTVVETRMVGAQTSEAEWPDYAVVSDEPKSVGGRGSAATPSGLFVASIGFADNVIFARQAAMKGMDFDSYETKVSAKWDRRGMFGIADADPAITDVVIETKVTTKAAPEQVAELLRLTHRRSPMAATVAKAASVQRKLFVNGTEVAV